MSNYQEFKAIIGDQMRAVEWREFGLDRDFPHLRPGTELGRIAIELATDWANLDRQWDNLEEGNAKGEVDDSEFQDFDGVWLPISMAKEVFLGFYGDVDEGLDFLLDKGEKPLLYKALIADARDEQLQDIERSLDCPEKIRNIDPLEIQRIRDVSVGLVNDLSVLYWQESDAIAKSFQALGPKARTS